MRGFLCLLRFLFSFPTNPPMCGHDDALCTGPRSHSWTDLDSGRSISSVARERSGFNPAHRTGRDRAGLGSRTTRRSGSYLELFALLPSSGDWGQSGLGIAGLQLVETPAEESPDDRDRYQRDRAWAGYAIRIR